MTSSTNTATNSVVVALATGGDTDVAAAQIAFHLLAGAERVLVESRPGPDGGLGPSLAALCRSDPRIALVDRAGRNAHGGDGDWLIEARPGEFWWPHAGSLPGLLEAIPQRYHTLNALVRPLAVAGDAVDAVAGAVARDVRPSAQPAQRLRPVHRVAMARWLEDGDGRPRPGDPLRGWYPLEVLTLPPPGTPPLAAAAVAGGLGEGSLVADTRLRDALVPLRRPAGDELGPFALPPGGAPADLPLPSLADEAAYAVEVAGVGESEPDAVARQLAELERRVGMLESDLWRRVSGRIVRMVSRS